ncbi:MAG: flagellin lysine-N-methylase [Lachnospiraceae bacterium]|nr:flagellin lysine-N-methylase [Lachnospiraceae bacterium]
MRVFRPDFYKEFQCIGSACQDTCCAQWEIEVDEASAERYAEHQGPLAEDFRKYLVRKEEENYFRLTAEKRCPFLNEQNLCRMILTMGEEYICDICREHPRFYHWFGEYTEVGLGLSCEEAGRLLFDRREPLKFELLSDEEEGEDPELSEEDVWVQLLLRGREELISMLQNRKLSLRERCGRLLDFAEQVQPFLDEEDLDGMEEYLEQWQLHQEEGNSTVSENGLREMLNFFEQMESLDQSWPREMQALNNSLSQLLVRLPDFEEAVKRAGRELDYEHLLVYFVFRYFMEAIYDSNLLSPLRFAVVSLRMIALLDLKSWSSGAELSLEERIRITKWYSKEIEYCPDNMERLAEVLEERIWQ